VQLETVGHARIFLEKGSKDKPPGEMIFIRDVAKGAGFGERAGRIGRSLLTAKLRQSRDLQAGDRPASLEDIATLFFPESG